MTPWVKLPESKPEDLSSLPGSRVVAGHSLRLSSDFHMSVMPYVCHAYAGLSVCVPAQPAPCPPPTLLNVGKNEVYIWISEIYSISW